MIHVLMVYYDKCGSYGILNSKHQRRAIGNAMLFLLNITQIEPAVRKLLARDCNH
jgi:hypothetical protein